MLGHKTVAVVMPAYNAAVTLERSVMEIPEGVVDELLLVDDASSDMTVDVARGLGIRTFVHDRNRGYGANQKTCYREALLTGADIFILLHPDYQYSPRLIPSLASMLASGEYDLVLASRFLAADPRRGGMPAYKYWANRVLTWIENQVTSAHLSEYHTGFRGFSRRVLEELPLLENSDDFLFDNQILLQALHAGFRIGEISCPTRYFEEASSIDFKKSVRYGLGVLEASRQFLFQKHGWAHYPIFEPHGRKLLEYS